MAGVSITTRISKAAAAHLRGRAAKAPMGTSAYASRLLEKALFDPGDPSAGSEGPPVDVPRPLLETLLSEALFNSSALERFIAKQPGLADQLRADARARASALLDAALGAPSKRKTPERPGPSDGRAEVKRGR